MTDAMTLLSFAVVTLLALFLLGWLLWLVRGDRRAERQRRTWRRKEHE